MNKKLLSVLLAALLTFSVISLAFAAGTPTISVSSATAAPGESVTLKVSVANNPGMNTFTLSFNYDKTRLNLTSVTKAEALPGQFTYSKKAVWLNSEDTTYNGEILTLNFDVLETAANGDAAVAVAYNSGDIANYDEDDVDFELVAGKVTVSKPVGEMGKFEVGTTTAAPGETVDVALRITKNPGINTFTLGFSYDTSRLNLVSVIKADALPGQFTYSRKAVWLNSEDTTYTGDALILTFKVLDNAEEGDASVAVTYNSGDIANYDEDDVDFELVAGKITVQSNNPPLGVTGKVSVTSVKGKAGQEVNVNVVINENPGIVAMGLDVTYDARLTLIGVTDGGILGTAMHGTNYTKNPYFLKWENYTVTENFTATGTLATLTFKIPDSAQDGDTYEISLSYEEDNSEIVNVDLDDVDFDTEAGTISVKNYTIGDVNDDGKINNKDSAILSRYLAKWDGYEDQIVSMEAADINQDGKVNNKDSAILSRYLAKWDGYDSYFAS